MSQTVRDDRRQALIEIIASQRVYTQSELAGKIAARGFTVTQTTISRDIEHLQIVKGPKGYEVPVNLSGQDKWMQTLKLHAIAVSPVGEYLLVMRTEDSAALMVANDIDQASLEGVVGTIAGVDTVFIAVQNQSAQKKWMQEINKHC